MFAKNVKIWTLTQKKKYSVILLIWWEKISYEIIMNKIKQCFKKNKLLSIKQAYENSRVKNVNSDIYAS